MSAYLDWAATAPPDADVLSESLAIALECFANPSSVHAPGKLAAARLAEARERCAQALGARPDALVFTSGGTESDHLPLLSLLQRPIRGTIAISAIEHPAISEQAKALEATGWKCLTIPVNRDGFVTPEAVRATLRDDTAFVAVMAVNNETGAIQPIREIGDALVEWSSGKRKPHFHVDAVQAAGKIPLELAKLPIDSAAISAHKLGGPRGIGLLYLARRVEPFIRGGGQEGGLRPGTENLAGAWALSRCLEKAAGSLRGNAEPERARNRMARLFRAVADLPGFAVIPESRMAEDDRFSPYILQCTNRYLPGEVLVRSLSDRVIAVSTGSACSSRKKTRPVLQAMHVSGEDQQNAFRVSIGSTTTDADIDALAAALAAIAGIQ